MSFEKRKKSSREPGSLGFYICTTENALMGNGNPKDAIILPKRPKCIIKMFKAPFEFF